ncbi:hypothetical protein Adt_46522 [Abeliophyllum distichum]|uniref:Uncharacterized protein n=1 Tax=Abeliophyllum distichum TaxID=126358 RepID=A0ABD1NZG1_9LAMI
MVDVMLHGGDGAGDLLHQPPHRFVLRVQRVSKGNFHFLDSKAASNVSRGTSNQFCEDDPHFAMYEAHICRMERTIAHLTANIQLRLIGVVPEHDEEVGEDKNDSRGLGDQ